MEFSTYFPIFFLWFVIFSQLRRRQKILYIQQILNQTRKENTKMFELAKKFIGKECSIYSIDNQFKGIITEVTDNAILVEKDGSMDLINLNFVVRIKENKSKMEKKIEKIGNGHLGWPFCCALGERRKGSLCTREAFEQCQCCINTP